MLQVKRLKGCRLKGLLFSDIVGMGGIQKNIFTSVCVDTKQVLELVDVFDIGGKKRIELQSHSSLTYLVVGSSPDINIEIVTSWPSCSCKIFWIFVSDTKHPVTWSLQVSLTHSHTSADVELISFLYDGARVAIDWSIDIAPYLDNVHSRLLEHTIVLGKDISVKTLPKLTIASHNVRASHGAKIDMLDPQKLLYMMSRGLTQWQSQNLLIRGYVEYVASQFTESTAQQIRLIDGLDGLD